MAGRTTPIGEPAFRERTDERHFTGPAGWSLPTRARDLADVLNVEVVLIHQEPRRLHTRERVSVRVRGHPRDLSRYWRRVEEVADAAQRPDAPYGRWSLRALLEFLTPWS